MPSSPHRTVATTPRALIALIAGAVALATLGGGPGTSPSDTVGQAPLSHPAADVISPSSAQVAPASVVTSAGVVGPVAVPPALGAPEPETAAPGSATDVVAPAAPGSPAGSPGSLPVDPAPGQVPEVVTGTVVRAYADIGHVDEAGHAEEHPGVTAAKEGDQPGLLTWVHTDDGLAVRVPTEQMREIPDGATVRLELGVRRGPVGSDPAGDETVGHEVLAAEVLELPPTTELPDVGQLYAMAASTPHKVTVVMMTTAGSTADGMTGAQLTNMIGGTVSPFWSEQTGGAVSFSVEKVVGWVSTTASCSSYSTVWSDAARAAGWTSGDGKHLMVYLPTNAPNCYSGLGTVGSGLSSGGQSYVRASLSALPSIMTHELGHNLGLDHSNGLLCAGSPDGVYSGSTWSNGCRADGYRDYYDVMGTSWSSLGSLNALHASGLGVLTAASRTDVTSPTRATLSPMSGLAGMRALRLVDGGTTYWVEYRPATGRDTWLSSGGSTNYNGLAPGVIVRRSDPTPYNTKASMLLDGTPSAQVDGGDWKSPVPVGSTLNVASGRFTVKVEQAGTDAAQIAVAVNGVWPSAGAPVQVSSPAAGSRQPIGTVVIAGSGTASEGTLLYEITTSTGTAVASGFVGAGANGEIAPFAVGVPLGAGSYTASVWVPDESDGESSLGPRPFEVRRSFTVG